MNKITFYLNIELKISKYYNIELNLSLNTSHSKYSPETKFNEIRKRKKVSIFEDIDVYFNYEK